MSEKIQTEEELDDSLEAQLRKLQEIFDKRVLEEREKSQPEKEELEMAKKKKKKQPQKTTVAVELPKENFSSSSSNIPEEKLPAAPEKESPEQEETVKEEKLCSPDLSPPQEDSPQEDSPQEDSPQEDSPQEDLSQEDSLSEEEEGNFDEVASSEHRRGAEELEDLGEELLQEAEEYSVKSLVLSGEGDDEELLDDKDLLDEALVDNFKLRELLKKDRDILSASLKHQQELEEKIRTLKEECDRQGDFLERFLRENSLLKEILLVGITPRINAINKILSNSAYEDVLSMEKG